MVNVLCVRGEGGKYPERFVTTETAVSAFDAPGMDGPV